VVAGRAAHDDARGAVVDTTLREGDNASAVGAGEPRGGDIESEQVRKGTRDGITVEVRPFCHHSFFLDYPLGPNRSARIADGEWPCEINFAVTDSTNPDGPQT
jgi:hypothetical protein